MSVRKISADKIFDGYRFHDKHTLIVKEDGAVEDLVPMGKTEATEVYRGILVPGFVNAHCHLELSHMKGLIPEGTGLVDFILKILSDRHHPDEVILEFIQKAEDEMIGNGIVAVGDICNNTLTISQKKKTRIAYHNFIEVSGWAPALAGPRFLRSRDIFEEFIATLVPLGMQSSLVPHAPYSVSPVLWQLIQSYFNHSILSIHNQETEAENSFFRDGTGDFNRLYKMLNVDGTHHIPSGKSSLQTYYPRMQDASKILLVHNSFLSVDDLQYLEETSNSQTSKPQTFFCVCINANRYIERVLPPIQLLREHSANIVLGTDSLASNHSLSILDEMNTIRTYFPAIPLEELLQWATVNGAKALNLEERYGSFEKGKRPGMLLLDAEGRTLKKIV